MTYAELNEEQVQALADAHGLTLTGLNPNAKKANLLTQLGVEETATVSEDEMAELAKLVPTNTTVAVVYESGYPVQEARPKNLFTQLEGVFHVFSAVKNRKVYETLTNNAVKGISEQGRQFALILIDEEGNQVVFTPYGAKGQLGELFNKSPRIIEAPKPANIEFALQKRTAETKKTPHEEIETMAYLGLVKFTVDGQNQTLEYSAGANQESEAFQSLFGNLEVTSV